MTLTEQQIADGWKPHDGGPCPVAFNTPVEIRVRGGEVTRWERAAAVIWEYETWIAEIYSTMPRGCEVIAYREVQP